MTDQKVLPLLDSLPDLGRDASFAQRRDRRVGHWPRPRRCRSGSAGRRPRPRGQGPGPGPVPRGGRVGPWRRWWGQIPVPPHPARRWRWRRCRRFDPGLAGFSGFGAGPSSGLVSTPPATTASGVGASPTASALSRIGVSGVSSGVSSRRSAVTEILAGAPARMPSAAAASDEICSAGRGSRARGGTARRSRTCRSRGCA